MGLNLSVALNLSAGDLVGLLPVHVDQYCRYPGQIAVPIAGALWAVGSEMVPGSEIGSLDRRKNEKNRYHQPQAGLSADLRASLQGRDPLPPPTRRSHPYGYEVEMLRRCL